MYMCVRTYIYVLVCVCLYASVYNDTISKGNLKMTRPKKKKRNRLQSRLRLWLFRMYRGSLWFDFINLLLPTGVCACVCVCLCVCARVHVCVCVCVCVLCVCVYLTRERETKRGGYMESHEMACDALTHVYILSSCVHRHSQLLKSIVLFCCTSTIMLSSWHLLAFWIRDIYRHWELVSLMSLWVRDIYLCSEIVVSIGILSSWHLCLLWVRDMFCHCDFVTPIVTLNFWHLLLSWVCDIYSHCAFVLSIGKWVRDIYCHCEFVTFIVLASSWHLFWLFDTFVFVSSCNLSALWVRDICCHSEFVSFIVAVISIFIVSSCYLLALWVRDTYRHCEFCDIYRRCEFVRSVVIVTLIVMVRYIDCDSSVRIVYRHCECEKSTLWVRDMYHPNEFESSRYVPSLWVRGICLVRTTGVCIAWTHVHQSTYGVATIGRLLKIVGHFCKRAL